MNHLKISKDLEGIVNALPHPMLLFRNVNGNFELIKANEPACTIFQIQHQEDEFKTFGELFPQLAALKIESELVQVLTRNTLWRSKALSFSDAKNSRVYDTMAFRISASILGIVFQDITDQRNAEVELIEQQKFINAIYQVAPVGLIIADHDSALIRDLNLEALRMFEGKRHMIAGKKINDFLIPGNREENDSDDIQEGIFRKMDGKGMPVLFRKSDIQLQNTYYTIYGFVDISLLKEAEKELKKAKEEAESASKTKSQFLATISHELRTPMNAIIGISGMLVKYQNDNLTPKQAEALQIIHKSGTHLLELINDILDLSRIEAGKMVVTYETVYLSSVLTEIRNIIKGLLKGKPVRFDINIAETVPKTLITDRKKLHQILINLLGNSVKFTEKGLISLTVSYRNERFYFDVSDTGIGIKKEDQKIIFDEFRQIDGSASRKHQGTGLGLSITKKLVSMLGGEISVESEPGVGTTMRFWLPAFSEERIRELSRNTERVIELTKKRILVIEKDPGYINSLVEYLVQSGYDAQPAENGFQGLKKLVQIQPDIVLIGNDIEGIICKEFLRKIIQDGRLSKIPVVILGNCPDEWLTGQVRSVFSKKQPYAVLRGILEEQCKPRILLACADDILKHTLLAMLEKTYSVLVSGEEDTIEKASFYTPELTIIDQDSFGPKTSNIIAEITGKRAANDTSPILFLVSNEANAINTNSLERIHYDILKKPVSENSLLQIIGQNLRLYGK
ncbi:MAG: ATP-binding protein [Bacteroidales bacterium]